MDDVEVLRDEILIDTHLRDKEVEELKQSLNFAFHKIEDQKKEINDLKQLCKDLDDKINAIGADTKKLKETTTADHDRLIYQDDYGRRNSLRFRNIAEDRRENW